MPTVSFTMEELEYAAAVLEKSPKGWPIAAKMLNAFLKEQDKVNSRWIR